MSSNKPIYTAVLMPLRSLRNENELSLPLLESENEPAQKRITATSIFVQLILGLIVGAAFSVFGFQVLVNDVSLSEWSHLQVVLFALGWSTITGVSSYTIFLGVHCCGLSTPTDIIEGLEYYFAIGVFIGFCIACTVTDIRYGLPLHSIFLSLSLACAWIALMIHLTPRSEPEEEERESKRQALPSIAIV